MKTQIIKTETIRILGMTCINCQTRIERKLKSTAGIETAAVSFNDGTAAVTYDSSIVTMKEIIEVVEKLGYKTLDGKARVPIKELVGTLVIILSLYALLQGLGIGAMTSAFPLAQAGASYGLLFVIGLVTSVHCLAMCGGINLSQCIPQTPSTTKSVKPLESLNPSILYNAGRVASYTITGVIVGALGRVVSVSGRFQGAVQLIAGVFMVLMGINMLGLFPGLRRFSLRTPTVFSKRIDKRKASGKSPLIVGLLNGLMPCGPLQAMQLYALSTGGPIAGGISMFIFSMGTVPLMFGVGALGRVLGKAPKVMKIGAALVTVMGLTMFTYGFNLLGLNLDFIGKAVAAKPSFMSPAKSAAPAPAIENGVQLVSSTLSGGRYPAITVQQGVPVKWTINAPPGSVNSCNNRMIIREYNIEYAFKTGENIIEFIPDRAGKFSYSCWMGMIRSSITVLDEGQIAVAAVDPGEPKPSPAGVTIPTNKVALAKKQKSGPWTVKINLRDDGVDPAVIVVQRNVLTLLAVNNDSTDPGNDKLIFPAYDMQLYMKQGDNAIMLTPTDDFDFSTGDNVFYGYVKVVDDIENIDIEAIKTEAAEFETLVYPNDRFGAATQGAGCCIGGVSILKEEKNKWFF
jgi:sulfite exporter TauE/SafE/copper chaperone CopZ/plastocyanin domain-containing protein